MSWISPKFWSEISVLGSPKDHKLTLKFLAFFNDPAKTVFVSKKQAQNILRGTKSPNPMVVMVMKQK